MSEQGAEIQEVSKTGISRIDRFFGKLTGDDISREYVVPSVLDQEIKESHEISIFLKGPKEDLQLSCKTPEAIFFFNDLAPKGTIFSINKSNKAGWEVFEEENRVLVPSNLKLLRKALTYGPIHEISHLWEKEVPEWAIQVDNAKAVLGDKIKQNIVMNLSNNPAERQKEVDAWITIEKGERRATEIGLYIIGRLKSFGIDVLPKYPDVQSLFRMANSALVSHRQFDSNPFRVEDAEKIINGDLPYPELKVKIDTQIAKVLSMNPPASVK